MSNPWKISEGKAKALPLAEEKREGKGKERAGKTVRNPRPHAARTGEKNAGILPKLPARTFDAAAPEDQLDMLHEVKKEWLDEHAAVSERLAKKARMANSSPARGKQQGGGSASGSRTGAKVARRQHNPYITSPPDLLTGERDGGNSKGILVSPISLGRTRAASIAASAPGGHED